MKKILVSLLCVILVLTSVCVSMAEESEDVTLKVLTEYVTIDLNTDPSGEAIEEVTGVSVEYSSLPSSDSTTKLNAILAAQEDYDVVIMSYSDFINTVSLGAYMSLNDLLEEYGQGILDGTEESLWSNVTIDGEIYGIPYRLSSENYSYGLRVRTDLLEEAGIEELPTTIDEFYDFLTTVKEELDIIPLTGDGAIVDVIASAFGITTEWVVTDDGSITNRVTTEGAREYVEFMHTLYEEGLIDSEWAQNTSTTEQEKFFSGNALMYSVAWWNEPTATETILANFPEATLDYIAPLENDEGESGVAINRGADMVTVILKVSDKAEEAIQWINAQVEDADTFRYLVIGEEGTHYEIDENGEYVPIQTAFTDERYNANSFLTATITEDYGTYWEQTRVRKDDTLYAEYVKMQENIEGATVYYDPTSYMSPNSEFTSLYSSISTYITDTMLEMIVGTRDISEWDDFVQEYYDMGGDTLEEIVNEWWDSLDEKPVVSHD